MTVSSVRPSYVNANSACDAVTITTSSACSTSSRHPPTINPYFPRDAATSQSAKRYLSVVCPPPSPAPTERRLQSSPPYGGSIAPNQLAAGSWGPGRTRNMQLITIAPSAPPVHAAAAGWVSPPALLASRTPAGPTAASARCSTSRGEGDGHGVPHATR